MSTNFYGQIGYPYSGSYNSYGISNNNSKQNNTNPSTETVKVVENTVSDGAKVAIASALILTVGAALYRCRGGISKLMKKIMPKAGKAAQKTATTGESIAQKTASTGQKTASAKNIKPKSPVATTPERISGKTPSTPSQNSSAATKNVKPSVNPETAASTQIQGVKALSSQEFEKQVSILREMPDSSLCKGAKDYLGQLKPHNFAGDKSEILVTSKFNGSNLGYESVNLSQTPFTHSIKRPDTYMGEKITVQCLKDGRKAVYVITPSGGKQPCGRSFENVIKVVSDGKEFTPIQKALIEIMSTRGPIEKQGFSDILAVANFNNGGHLGVNKDILLSAIHTAREQAADKIDSKLVQKALSVANPNDIFRF